MTRADQRKAPSGPTSKKLTLADRAHFLVILFSEVAGTAQTIDAALYHVDKTTNLDAIRLAVAGLRRQAQVAIDHALELEQAAEETEG